MKNLLCAILLVVLCAIGPVLAGKPPRTLLQEINKYPIVHDQYCRVQSMGIEDVDCLIYFNQTENVVYVVLFDEALVITHIIRNNADTSEQLLWCRYDVCV